MLYGTSPSTSFRHTNLDYSLPSDYTTAIAFSLHHMYSFVPVIDWLMLCTSVYCHRQQILSPTGKPQKQYKHMYVFIIRTWCQSCPLIFDNNCMILSIKHSLTVDGCCLCIVSCFGSIKQPPEWRAGCCVKSNQTIEIRFHSPSLQYQSNNNHPHTHILYCVGINRILLLNRRFIAMRLWRYGKSYVQIIWKRSVC